MVDVATRGCGRFWISQPSLDLACRVLNAMTSNRNLALANSPPVAITTASHPAIRLAAKPKKSAIGYIHLQCHGKPGASKQREGVVSV
jgi:hypothetical protein